MPLAFLYTASELENNFAVPAVVSADYSPAIPSLVGFVFQSVAASVVDAVASEVMAGGPVVLTWYRGGW